MIAPPRHIKHLVRTFLPADQQEHALLAIQYGNEADVLDKLDAARPRTAEYLRASYRDYGQRSLHLWRVTRLSNQPRAVDMAQLLSDRLDIDVSERTRTIPPPRRTTAEPPQDRVARIAVTDDLIMATVRVITERRIPEDTPEGVRVVESFVSVDVIVRLDDGCAEVYAGYNYALRALKAFLCALYGTDCPPARSRAWGSWLSAVRFSEGELHVFAAKHKMKFCGVGGPDPKGLQGGVTWESKMDGEGMEGELNPTDQRIIDQLAESNDYRKFRFDFTHRDTYTEPVRVCFSFGPERAVNVTFERRTSRPAQRWLITEILKSF